VDSKGKKRLRAILKAVEPTAPPAIIVEGVADEDSEGEADLSTVLSPAELANKKRRDRIYRARAAMGRVSRIVNAHSGSVTSASRNSV
jgi:hypothetical protein